MTRQLPDVTSIQDVTAASVGGDIVLHGRLHRYGDNRQCLSTFKTNEKMNKHDNDDCMIDEKHKDTTSIRIQDIEINRENVAFIVE
eukprot:CAMPEP_0182421778 /NCGR_PEP_ID=MMETSP1167-20130531/7271_1 /TAXON_ID=2988 /ORGANISM="Mallomonas Sp, Strain CCMP3275" /LENGTH=85 /DNA_ID=CAMNT_0024599249 /DNA_START=922 /DNA_END=1179 /DNA_ORIENTATION=+